MIGTLGAMLLSEIFQEKLLKLHEFALHFNSEALSFHLFSTYTRKQMRQKCHQCITFNQLVSLFLEKIKCKCRITTKKKKKKLSFYFILFFVAYRKPPLKEVNCIH